MKNKEISFAWKRNITAKNYNNTFHTDGFDLYSYGLLIGTTSSDGQKILYDYTAATNNFISRTTTTHVNLAAVYMDVRLNPGEPMCSNLLHTVTDHNL